MFTLAVVGCKENPEHFIQHIGGYWEIDEVRLNDGTVKDYGYNENIDFFELTDSISGSRRKLKANLDGTFTVNGDTESFRASVEDGQLYLTYKTPFDQWKEKVLKASPDELVIENEGKIVYQYKRYKPLDLN